MDITFIGGGNMALAMIAGLEDKYSISIIEPNSAAKIKFKKTLSKVKFSKINFYKNANEFESSKIIPKLTILAIKPQHLINFYVEIKKKNYMWIKKTNFLSIIAGAKIQTLKTVTKNSKIIRAMPNTPAFIGKSLTGLYFPKNIPINLKKLTQKILSQIGEIVILKSEKQLDSITAISGSGPAYFYKFIEIFENSALKIGLSKKNSKEIIIQTITGSLSLLSSTNLTAKQLRKNVSSKGGTTEAAIKTLDENLLDQIFLSAIVSAKNRSNDLAKELNIQIKQHTNK